MIRDLKRICPEIKDTPHPLDDLQKVLMARQSNFDPQARFRLVRPDSYLAEFTIDLDSASVAIS